MSVPIPARLSYRCMTTTTSARYGIRGLMTFAGESPTREAARTVWGAMPSRMNRGMNTGASNAHLAITCGRMKLAALLIRITPTSSHTAPMWRCSRMSPSLTAATSGMWRAVAPSANEEDQRDDHDQAVHERRVADDLAGSRVAQRRARDDREQRHRRDHRECAPQRVSQAPGLVGRADLLRVLDRIIRTRAGDGGIVRTEPPLD